MKKIILLIICLLLSNSVQAGDYDAQLKTLRQVKNTKMKVLNKQLKQTRILYTNMLLDESLTDREKEKKSEYYDKKIEEINIKKIQLSKKYAEDKKMIKDGFELD